MSEYALAIVSPATKAELFDPYAGVEDVPLRFVHATGAALALVEEARECRTVVVERELEPQLGRLVQRLRRAVPGVEIAWLAPAVGEAPRAELRQLRVDWIDRATPGTDLARLLAHRFRRASLQARAGIIGRSPRIVESLETIL